MKAFDKKLIPLGSLVIVESDRSEPRFADITITNLASETLSPFIQSLLSLYGMPGDRVVDPKTQVLHFFIHTKLDKDIHEFVRYKLRNVKNALELYSIKEELEFRDCNPKVASIMVDILRRGGIYTEIDRIGASMQVPIEMKS